ncbi:MAG: hypothetical protein MZU91_12085 [Desulfosudis oleivorans]|nr:hypothetical protein [Desulfosudis oleivorans]
MPSTRARAARPADLPERRDDLADLGARRLPHAGRSARAGSAARCTVGELHRGDFIADGRDEVLTATRENLRARREPDQGDGGRRRGLGLRPARRRRSTRSTN